MEYDLVEEPTTDDLVKEVKIWIDTGWKPQGGIVATPNSDSPTGLLFFKRWFETKTRYFLLTKQVTSWAISRLFGQTRLIRQSWIADYKLHNCIPAWHSTPIRRHLVISLQEPLYSA